MNLRRIHGAAVRALRESLGYSRSELAEAVGVFPGHLGKIERGEVVRVKPQLLSRLALALDVENSKIAEARELTDSEKWADAHDYTLLYTQELARDGRIEGAYQDSDGKWRMAEDASLLPATERARERWRKRDSKHGRKYQRARRERERAKSMDIGGDSK